MSRRCIEDGHATGDDTNPFAGKSGNIQRIDATDPQQILTQLADALQADALFAPAIGLGDAADGFHGSRGAYRLGPSALAIIGDKLLKFHADFRLCPLPPLRGDLAVFKEAQGAGNAADLETLALQCLVALSDDELGTAAANVDDQARVVVHGQSMGHALIDQAGFLAAGNHLDGVPERRLCGQQESLRIRQLANRVGGNGAHMMGLEPFQALAKTCQARERGFTAVPRERSVLAQAGGEANGLAQAINNPQLPMGVSCYHQMKTVGANVRGGDQVAIANLPVKVAGTHEPYFSRSASWAQWGACAPGVARR